jgi:hypothetical protein
LLNIAKRLGKERRIPGDMGPQIKMKLKEEEKNREVSNIISEILNPMTSQKLHTGGGRQKIQYNDVYELPSDQESYSYVELTRLANASAQYQQNLFNTTF